ncbi:hypothetical protein F511_25560 [Dorcoceras hygrometricum]|uniref:Uncharacterized protein n=1 Tax=Dorcoceras hygrometricum TaxID=472368 RepID=A0A2Z7A6Q3_9LAMI|nr:hypothetical protein F511_25560 [Dorcoceras hygrometricum]
MPGNTLDGGRTAPHRATAGHAHVATCASQPRASSHDQFARPAALGRVTIARDSGQRVAHPCMKSRQPVAQQLARNSSMHRPEVAGHRAASARSHARTCVRWGAAMRGGARPSFQKQFYFR